jgi:ribosomal protein S27AE
LGFDVNPGYCTVMTEQRNSPPNDYREQWQHYKSFRKLLFLIRLGWVAVIIGYILFVRAYGHFPPWEFLGLYVMLYLAACLYESLWTCPRCGQSFSNPARFFYRGGGYKGGIAPECVHCRLPAYAADDSVALPPRVCSRCKTIFADRSSKFCTKCGARADV